MVLSAVRTDEPIMECEDRDFETAMELTKVYLAHGLNVYEKINNRENKLPLNEERLSAFDFVRAVPPIATNLYN